VVLVVFKVAFVITLFFALSFLLFLPEASENRLAVIIIVHDASADAIAQYQTTAAKHQDGI